MPHAVDSPAPSRSRAARLPSMVTGAHAPMVFKFVNASFQATPPFAECGITPNPNRAAALRRGVNGEPVLSTASSIDFESSLEPAICTNPRKRLSVVICLLGHLGLPVLKESSPGFERLQATKSCVPVFHALRSTSAALFINGANGAHAWVAKGLEIECLMETLKHVAFIFQLRRSIAAKLVTGPTGLRVSMESTIVLVLFLGMNKPVLTHQDTICNLAAM